MKKLFYILKQKYSDKNNSQLLNNISAAFILKGAAMFVAVFTTPAYIKYFSNAQVLGVWFTLISVFNWIFTFDFGIGNGLRNNLVPAIVAKDYKKIREYVSSGYIILGVISLAAVIIGNILADNVGWNYFFNISEEIIPKTTLITAVRIVFLGIMLQFWLKLITSILYAMQKTALSSFLSLISTVTLLLYVIFFKTGNIITDLINLSIAQVITANLPLIVTTIIVFCTTLKNAAPKISNFKFEYAKSITGLGGTFFVIQLSLLVISSTNEMLITRLYNTSDVVDYQIYNKFFHLVLIMFTLLTQPVWSAISKAYAEKRYLWIKKTYKIFNRIAAIALLGCLAIALVLQKVVDIWLAENSIPIDFKISLAFIAISGFMMFINSATSIANGIGKLRCQFVCMLIGAVLKIPLCYFLSLYFKSWASVIYANAIVLIPVLIFQPIAIQRLFKTEFSNQQITNDKSVVK